jgi:microcompartment protein CcmL/EutN
VNPAIGMLEFESIVVGIVAGDAMVKRAPVAEVIAGTIHPGRYLVMVSGDVASVEEALQAGREGRSGSLLDEVFLPDVHRAVVGAIAGGRASPAGEALGIVETATAAATVLAADAAVKGAHVTLLEIRLADGLGGKAYALFSGSVADVEAAVAAGIGGIPATFVVESVVIPQLDVEIAENLLADGRFGRRVGWGV